MFVELETRRGDGLTVTLEWNRATGQTQIVVRERTLRRTDRVRGSARQRGRRVSPPVQVRAMNAIPRRVELTCRLAELRRLLERPKHDRR